MIGQVARLRGSNFRKIPNPTPDRWNRNLSACTMMLEFQKHITKLSQQPKPSSQVLWIHKTSETLHSTAWKDNDTEIDIDMREAVHSTLDSCTEWLLNQASSASVLHVIGAHITAVLEQLNDPDSFLSSQDCDTEAAILDFYFKEMRLRVIDAAQRRRSTVASPVTPTDASGKEDIWLMLQFRMYCWWLLHDFDETDTLRLPPRLKGSRLPVFIL